MPKRSVRFAFAAIVSAIATIVLPGQAQAAKVVDLRVLTSTAVLEPGSSYVTGTEFLRSDPKARCFIGGAGGSGERVKMPGPTALGVAKSAVRWNSDLVPISATDEFGFGFGVCGFGGIEGDASKYWALFKNYEDPAMAGDQVSVANGDQVLWYLTGFPPPPLLELQAPAGTSSTSVEVTVLEHSCETGPPPDFVTTCGAEPAAGAAVTGGTSGTATTDVDGKATVSAPASGTIELQATRASDVPSEPVSVCSNPDTDQCPSVHGKEIFGRARDDIFSATAGWDRVRSGRGDDRVDLTDGGRDIVACGKGRDRVLVAPGDDDDEIAASCERVVETT